MLFTSLSSTEHLFCLWQMLLKNKSLYLYGGTLTSKQESILRRGVARGSHTRKILRGGCGQAEPGSIKQVKLVQEIALVIAHIKARSKVSVGLNRPFNNLWACLAADVHCVLLMQALLPRAGFCFALCQLAMLMSGEWWWAQPH